MPFENIQRDVLTRALGIRHRAFGQFNGINGFCCSLSGTSGEVQKFGNHLLHVVDVAQNRFGQFFVHQRQF